jgi:RNA polymerase sigma-70 factor, ECF subfamily
MCIDLHPHRSTPAVASSLVDDDEVLVDRLRSGDESAFVELVRRYQQRLLRVAEATVGRGSVAQEVTQDTWLAVFRGIDRFEGRSSFKSWLFSILLNRARSAARREDRAGRPDSTIGEERFDANGAWAQPPEPWADRAVDRLVAAQLSTRVHDLLAMLPEAQRQVVVLTDVEEVPPAEVASMLGLTEGNRRVLLHRGRARLRQLLAEEMSRS